MSVLPINRGRLVFPVITFGGTSLTDYLNSFEYVDPAAGASDEFTMNLANDDLIWLKDKYPEPGTKVGVHIGLHNWRFGGDNRVLKAGEFTIDSVSFSGGPSTCDVSALSKPADSCFSTQERTQVWEDATLQAIFGELAGRYGMSLQYSAPAINVTAVEQSQKTDAAFIEEMCESFDLGMKIFEDKLVVFDWGQMEAQSAAFRLGRSYEDFAAVPFEGDSWEYSEDIDGIYTGAVIQYKTEDSDEEISLTVGDTKRLVYLNETVSNAAEADKKARAEVNKSNRKAATFNCDIWPCPDITSGMVIYISGLGHADGNYFIDKMTFSGSGGSGAKQSLEMHRCQPRL